jgi:putative nucleotidyltransferase with HDIG domain
MKKLSRNNIIIILMLIGSVILISLILPSRDKKTLVYAEGKPWHYPMLTAPFDIPIEYDSITAKKITDSIDAKFVKIYSQNFKIADVQIKKLDKVLSMHHEISPMVRQRLISTADDLYTAGIVDNDTYDLIQTGKLPQVRLLNNNIAQLTPTSNLRSVRQAYSYMDSLLNGNDYHEAMAKVSISDFLVPNVTLDSAENRKVLENAHNTAIAPIGVVQTGESIIYPGNLVTAQKFMILKKYESMMHERNMSMSENEDTTTGQIVVVALLMLVFYFFMKLMRPRTFASLRSMIFLITFMTIFIIIVYAIIAFRINMQYVIPFGLVPIIIMTFYDSRMSFFVHMIVVLTCSLTVREPSDFIFMQFFAGLIAIASIQELTRRSQLVRCAFFIFLAYSVSYVALYVMHEGNINDMGWHPFLYFAVNCIVLSFAYILIFIIEKLFGFTSTVTLVELSDINNPVLRELSETCPGTFQHALQVANLATEAAHSIGANIQLTRAGALYHDIGKIDNPAFFTENQIGVNPHDTLTPEQSAKIVIDHVLNGLKRADKAKLPQSIKDFIAQHHGKGLTRYFYTMACKANPGKEISTALFTYPGPNPQTKETAIVMMADACDAATKSLSRPDEKSIENIVNKIVDSQIADGLLKETPISFRDVETIKRTFIEMLRTFYHTRVSYPDDIKPKTVEENEAMKAAESTDVSVDDETPENQETPETGETPETLETHPK